MRVGITALFATMIATFMGCSGEPPAKRSPRRSVDGRVAEPPLIRPANQPYAEQSPTSFGKIVGNLETPATIPADSTYTPPLEEQRVCGATAAGLPEIGDGSVPNGVVWLSDIRAGKPRPAYKRYDLEISRCKIDPIMMAVTVGGALNAGNTDAVLHRLEFVDHSTGKTVAVAPFTDHGEVIPYDRMLQQPTVLNIESSTRPWMRGWLAVFDHPYFGVTTQDGAFVLDSIPPGTYHLRAWHPRVGVHDQTVTVRAGEEVKLTIKLEPAQR
jgi:hypothetical protein